MTDSKKHQLNVVLGLFGAIGTIFGFYQYFESQKEKLPTFFDDPYSIKIISSEYVKDAPLKVSRSNGEEINGNVYSTKFYFFNQGELPLKHDEILEPIKVALNDSAAEILDFKILKVSRESIQLTLSMDSINSNSLNLNFKILEANDGLVAQITYVSNKVPNLIISGEIEGVKKFENTYVEYSELASYILSLLLSLGFFLVIIMIFYSVFTVGNSRLSERLGKRYQLILRSEENFSARVAIKINGYKVIISSVLIFIFILFISIPISRNIFREKNERSKSIVIPKSLR